MRQFFSSKSLHAQMVLAGTICVLIISIFAILVIVPATFRYERVYGEALRLRVMIVLILASVLSLVLFVAAVKYVLRPLAELRDGMDSILNGEKQPDFHSWTETHELARVNETFNQLGKQICDARSAQQEAERVLAVRTKTVDSLLDFSQTIQGAGKPDQIFSTLSHFLQTELSLAGLIIVSHEADAMPAATLKAAVPATVLCPERPIGDMDAAMCPCLRQNLPRCFKPEGTPVRCGIDACINLPPEKHSAYCIPFSVGRKVQVLVHMLLPEGVAWSDEQKQLAQTYVNTANSALVSLHLLDEAEKQSMTDSLTGLYNRRSMEDLLQREVALAERHGHPLSVVMIDMDHFKEINDTHGHAAGDHMLKSFADCVRITLRKTDLAFRYGGDEFCIALPQTAVAQAQQVVQKLRQAYAAVDFTSAIAHLENQPTLSIGIAERSKATNLLTLQNLLSAADQALYEAKSSSRNCIKVYQSPRAA